MDENGLTPLTPSVHTKVLAISFFFFFLIFGSHPAANLSRLSHWYLKRFYDRAVFTVKSVASGSNSVGEKVAELRYPRCDPTSLSSGYLKYDNDHT